MINDHQWSDAAFKLILSDMVEIDRMRGATPSQVDLVVRVAQRLLRSDRRELRAIGWQIAFGIGFVYARSVTQFLLAMEEGSKRT